MFRIPCFTRSVPASLAILAVLLAAGWGIPLQARETAGGISGAAEARQQIDVLAAEAPVFATLAARYRIESVSIVDGVESRSGQEGRFYFERGDDGRVRLAVYRDLGTVVETQWLLRDGELVRYFPASGYGHRVVAGSLDKDRTDFARFWRPFLAHLEPRNAIETAAGAIHSAAGKIVIRPDREAGLAARPGSGRLEYWGPPPDVELVFDAESKRLTQYARVLYGASGFRPGQVDVLSRSVARLEAPTVYDGILLPTRIAYEATLERHVAPYRISTLELFDVEVDRELPAAAFEPVWPSDTLLLDAEPRAPEAYRGAHDEPRVQVLLADHYLGTGQTAAGMRWVERFQAGLEGRRPRPSEVGHLARLLALAGQTETGRKWHLEALFGAREMHAANPGDAAVEDELVRYLAEYADFIAHGSGPRLYEQAGLFLERQLDEIETPLARARLANLATGHFALAGSYALAGDVLAAAGERVAGDAEAGALIEAGRLRLAERQDQHEKAERLRAKDRKIRALEARLDSLRSGGSETAAAEKLRRELEWLETHP